MSKSKANKPGQAKETKDADTTATAAPEPTKQVKPKEIEVTLPTTRVASVIQGAATSFFTTRQAGIAGDKIALYAEDAEGNSAETPFATARLHKIEKVILGLAGVTITNEGTGAAPYSPNNSDGFAKLNGYDDWASMRVELESRKTDLINGTTGYWHHWNDLEVKQQAEAA